MGSFIFSAAFFQSGSVAAAMCFCFCSSPSNSPRSKAAKDLARAAVVSAVVVGGALADGGVHVLSEAADATGDVIEHRYGAEVGASSRDGLQVCRDDGPRHSLFEAAVSSSCAQSLHLPCLTQVIKDMGTAAVAMRRVGVAAIVGQSVATAAVDLCVTDEAERAARRQEQAAKAASLGSDPILSMGMNKLPSLCHTHRQHHSQHKQLHQ
jgi:hypothetical protein